jgi:hypothetical protein
VEQIPDFITLQPYQTIFDPNNMPKKNIKKITEKLPITLPQGKDGRIIVKKIEKKEKEVWVHFDVEGDFVKERKQNFHLIKGKKIKPGSIVESEIDWDSNNRSNQIAKFKTPYREDLHFITTDAAPELLKDLELRIPIDKKELKKQEYKK